MIVSWEFNWKLKPVLIELNNVIALTPLAELAVLVASTWIDSLIALVFNIIVPNSGNTKPYEPLPETYPLLDKVPDVPLDPDINWNTLEDPIKELTFTSFELSVKCRVLRFPLPDNARFKEPGNKDSLYLDLSIDITQKSVAVTTLSPVPNVKDLVSSSNIKDLNCP